MRLHSAARGRGRQPGTRGWQGSQQGCSEAGGVRTAWAALVAHSGQDGGSAHGLQICTRNDAGCCTRRSRHAPERRRQPDEECAACSGAPADASGARVSKRRRRRTQLGVRPYGVRVSRSHSRGSWTGLRAHTVVERWRGRRGSPRGGASEPRTEAGQRESISARLEKPPHYGAARPPTRTHPHDRRLRDVPSWAARRRCHVRCDSHARPATERRALTGRSPAMHHTYRYQYAMLLHPLPD